MSNEILIALFSLLGTLVGSGGGILVSNKLVNYRLDQINMIVAILSFIGTTAGTVTEEI